MTKQRVFKKEYAQELLIVARGDFESAEALYRSNVQRKENIFFLCQQAIEKALKAALCWQEQPVPLVHDLGLLIDRFRDFESLPFSEDLVDLTQFATVRRYEESITFYNVDEIESVLQETQKVIQWAQALLKKP